METSLLVFVVGGTVVMAFGAALLRSELDLAASRRLVTGDSSLSKKSINWIGGISLVAALIICCLTS